jgi:hypothetical protein
VTTSASFCESAQAGGRRSRAERPGFGPSNVGRGNTPRGSVPRAVFGHRDGSAEASARFVQCRSLRAERSSGADRNTQYPVPAGPHLDLHAAHRERARLVSLRFEPRHLQLQLQGQILDGQAVLRCDVERAPFSAV